MQRKLWNRRQFLAIAAAQSTVLAAAGCGAPTPEGAARPNIVVYLADSLRVDGVGCLGGTASVSPVLDAMAEEAFVFENCYAQTNWTKPSIAALFTGMIPSVHQAVVTSWRAYEGYGMPPRRLPARYPTWAESMKAAGYRTASFQSNPHPRVEFGYDRGFDHYHFEVNELAQPQVARFEQWVDATADSSAPFFVFIHQIDPHAPYTPTVEDFVATHGKTPDEFAAGLSSGDRERVETWTQAYIDGEGEKLRAYQSEMADLGLDGIAYLRALYDGQIRRVDNALGQIQDFLKSRGMADNTVIAFTSDHGEAFGERSKFGHGVYMYNEELRVPLVIKVPGQTQGQRVQRPVALYDLYPTCVALGGGSLPAPLMAQPLLDANGRLIAPAERAIFSELDTEREDRTHWSRVMVREQQLIMDLDEGTGSREAMVYDLAADPGQKNGMPLDAVHDDPRWQAFVATYEQALAEHARLAELTGPPEYAAPSDEYDEEMRAIGYV